MKKIKIVFSLYILVNVFLFLYSFTQVDLGLTFLRNLPLHNLEMLFKEIGYFQRPISTYLYITLLVLFFSFYLFFIYLSKKRLITRKQIWILIIIQSAILSFSYNAFSYDLFNYIFDAKILTFYHQNPYLHTALDYPGDHMLSFMHWTHRSYPYGPAWLFLTVPLSFIGSNIFLFTFFLFKAVSTAAFLGTCYFLEKILPSKEKLQGLIFFAFNPLVIIESLVSSHIDIAMIFFSIWALYLLLNKEYIKSFFWFLFSAGIKFATGFLAPVFLFIAVAEKNKKSFSLNNIFMVSLLIMLLTGVFASFRTNFQPWYLLTAMPFAALLSKKFYVAIPVVVISFFSLLIYVPFLYTGNWDPPIPSILFKVMFFGVLFSILAVIGKFASQRGKI